MQDLHYCPRCNYSPRKGGAYCKGPWTRAKRYENGQQDEDRCDDIEETKHEQDQEACLVLKIGERANQQCYRAIGE